MDSGHLYRYVSEDRPRVVKPSNPVESKDRMQIFFRFGNSGEMVDSLSRFGGIIGVPKRYN
jgi:hypothetical protein